MLTCGYCGALIWGTCKDCVKSGRWGSKDRRDFPGRRNFKFLVDHEQKKENDELRNEIDGLKDEIDGLKDEIEQQNKIDCMDELETDRDELEEMEFDDEGNSHVVHGISKSLEELKKEVKDVKHCSVCYGTGWAGSDKCPQCFGTGQKTSDSFF